MRRYQKRHEHKKFFQPESERKALPKEENLVLVVSKAKQFTKHGRGRGNRNQPTEEDSVVITSPFDEEKSIICVEND